MRVLITGAAGFIGQILARELLSSQDNFLVLTDVIEPPVPKGAVYPQNTKCIKADLYDDADSVIDEKLDAVYIFHGIMSSGAEADFDLGMRVNVDATRTLLERLRKSCPGIRVIYASSEAVYGKPMPDILDESVLPTPESSYGCEKMMCELLINEYTRRGFINGFTLRFPTITVRPGKPTAAASSFISGIIREPMAEKECVVPMTDRSWTHWVCSPKTLVHNLVLTLSLPRDALPLHIRTVNAPGFTVSIQDMIDALVEVGGKEKLKFVKEEDDPTLKRILLSWADSFDNKKALGLGMKKDSSFVQLVREYKESMNYS